MAKAKERLIKCHSFLPGTRVLLDDGTTRRIEDVELGDRVTVTDPDTGGTVTREVVGTIVTEDDKYFVDLTIDTGGDPASLTSTTTHPIWVRSENRWLEAGDLEPGRTSAPSRSASAPTISRSAGSIRTMCSRGVRQSWFTTVMVSLFIGRRRLMTWRMSWSVAPTRHRIKMATLRSISGRRAWRRNIRIAAPVRMGQFVATCARISSRDSRTPYSGMTVRGLEVPQESSS
ncbi:Hint domain-containing protein [Streptomyces poriticola]|uniref:Hint domain-containing protein n=1 Tax=Streptomyces poriticola TaxID=3120506 RepID=UPI002FCDFA7B